MVAGGREGVRVGIAVGSALVWRLQFSHNSSVLRNRAMTAITAD